MIEVHIFPHPPMVWEPDYDFNWNIIDKNDIDKAYHLLIQVFSIEWIMILSSIFHLLLLSILLSFMILLISLVNNIKIYLLIYYLYIVTILNLIVILIKMNIRLVLIMVSIVLWILLLVKMNKVKWDLVHWMNWKRFVILLHIV